MKEARKNRSPCCLDVLEERDVLRGDGLRGNGGLGRGVDRPPHPACLGCCIRVDAGESGCCIVGRQVGAFHDPARQ